MDGLANNVPYQIYYLGHSAWAVETSGCYLLFDIQNKNVKPNGALTDGFVDLSRLQDKPVRIFYSHRHHDHYSRQLHQQSAAAPHVLTVLGDFTSPGVDNTITMRLRESLQIGGITIYTAASTDEGVCFLVKAGETVVFFAGDNADWGDGDSNRIYYGEIDYLAGLGIPVDIAFIPVCTFVGQRPHDMTAGAIYAVNTLRPGCVCPMHANGREHLYVAFTHDLQASGNEIPVLCADRAGWTYPPRA